MAPRKAAASADAAEGVRRSSRIADLPKPAALTAPKPRTKKGEATKGKKRKADAVEKDDDEAEEKPASKKVIPHPLNASSRVHC
jgi:hypothetical protein